MGKAFTTEVLGTCGILIYGGSSRTDINIARRDNKLVIKQWSYLLMLEGGCPACISRLEPVHRSHSEVQLIVASGLLPPAWITGMAIYCDTIAPAKVQDMACPALAYFAEWAQAHPTRRFPTATRIFYSPALLMQPSAGC
jgi:hypothetical protein